MSKKQRPKETDRVLIRSQRTFGRTKSYCAVETMNVFNSTGTEEDYMFIDVSTNLFVFDLVYFRARPIDIGNVFSQDTQKQSLVAFLIFGFLFFALFDVKHVDILFPCRENTNEKYF